MNTAQFDYLADLRADVITIISGTKNSNGYFGWDTTVPNSIIENQIKRLIEKYINFAKAHGIYVVTRYSHCSNPKHPGYPTEDRYGLSISYRDERFIWNGKQLYQGSRYSKCPCAVTNSGGENVVIDDFVYDPKADVGFCDLVSDFLAEVHSALRYTGRNQTRSGIREILLRVVLRINDAVLPVPVDEYIQSMRKDRA